jgi:hypothetical protein
MIWVVIQSASIAPSVRARMDCPGSRCTPDPRRPGSASRPVQGNHELAPRSLPEGVAGHQLLKLPHHFGVAAAGKLGLDVVLGGLQTELLQRAIAGWANGS